MKHKGLIIGGGILLVFVIFILIAAKNKANQKKEEAEQQSASTEYVAENSTESGTMANVEPTTEVKDSYKQQLGIGNEDKDQRVKVDRDEPTEAPTEEPKQTEPTYAVATKVFNHTEVPKVNMDGSRCKDYYAKVKLSDFGTFWGTSLTQEDFIGHKKYLVGVEQDNVTAEKGDLQSVGWLIDNLNAEKFQANDCIKFTNLHVIGALASDHVALLCSYDWYSAFGLDDTLVVFEDISGTLKPSDFTDGDVFSATVFVHNCKVLPSVAGKRVVVVEYALYDLDNSGTVTQEEIKMNEDAAKHLDD